MADSNRDPVPCPVPGPVPETAADPAAGPAPDHGAWLVCLCAGWCRTCDGYRATLEAVAAEFPRLQRRWIDVEDEAELVGDVEIETFPTLLVGDGAAVWFAGVVTPQPEVLRRLLASLLESRVPTVPSDPALRELAERLKARFAASLAARLAARLPGGAEGDSAG